jgi:hypothetical protein
VILQLGFIVWGIQLLWIKAAECWSVALLPEGFSGCGLSGAVDAMLAATLLGICVISIVPFGYLAALHTYLMLTNQTTYEILKGAQVPYLAAFYRGRERSRYRLPDDLFVLMWDELRQKGPPKPFSQGAVQNVVEQLWRPWPRPYVPRCQ